MPSVKIKTNRVSYDLNITYKYTLISGDSGVGKTVLFNTVALYAKDHTAVTCLGYDKLTTDTCIRIEELQELVGYIIFLDESSLLLHKYDSASLLEHSNNYFVIMCRDVTLGYKSVPLGAVMQMKSSGKYHTLVPKYSLSDHLFFPDRIICEDLRSGYHFIKNIYSQYIDTICYAKASEKDESGGRTKIAKFIEQCAERNLCIVFDSCAIGTEFSKIETSIKKNNKNVCFIDWLSFEYYILKSPLINHKFELDLYRVDNLEATITDILGSILIFGCSKSNLSKCLTHSGCVACVERYGCKYEHFSMNELLYWKVGDLLTLCKSHCTVGTGCTKDQSADPERPNDANTDRILIQ